VLVLSDVHSNLPAIEAVFDDAGCWDAGICAGDIVGYGPHPQECIDQISFKGFSTVTGNHDRAVATVETDWFNDDAQEAIRINRSMLPSASLRWLGSLPTGLSHEFNGVNVLVYHGSPTQPLTSYVFQTEAETHVKEYLLQTGADVLILGHTHIPYTVQWGNSLILNPGSVGQPRDGDPRASYLILDTESLKAEHRRVKYNIDATAEAIDAAGLPHRFATRLYRGT